MDFVGDPPILSANLGVLAGGFNPPTVAHLSIARTAVAHARVPLDAVIFVVPRRYPHKDYEGATMERRADLVALSIAGEPRFHLAITRGGLFIEIAREIREWNPSADPAFLCGRDAAERIAGWNYGEPDAFDLMLSEFRLLVTARDGEYRPAERHAGRITLLPNIVLPGPALPGTVLAEIEPSCVSSTIVRERIRMGLPWEHLVPDAIVERVRAIYS